MLFLSVESPERQHLEWETTPKVWEAMPQECGIHHEDGAQHAGNFECRRWSFWKEVGAELEQVRDRRQQGLRHHLARFKAFPHISPYQVVLVATS